MSLKKFIKKIVGRAVPHAQYLGDHRVLMTTHLGYNLILNSRDFSLTPTLLTTGEWEPDTTEIISRVVKPGMTVVEIGSNIGFHTIDLARRVGRKGKVYAFEADPLTHAFLDGNIALNGCGETVRAFQMALSDKNGTVAFNKLKSHGGSSSLLRVPEDFIERLHDNVETVSVPVSTLDEFARNHSLAKIDLVKMDAEGSEYYIFDGMKEVLESNPAMHIICEYNAEILDYNNISAQMFFDKISRMGFEAWCLRKGKLVRFDMSAIEPRTFIDLYLKPIRRP